MSRRLRDSAERSFKKTLHLMQKGQSKKAHETLQKAEEASHQAEADDILLSIMSIKGGLMLDLGALDEAVKICGQASNLFADLSTKDPENDFFQQCLQTNLNNVGTAGNHFKSMGRYPQAKNAYETGLSISQKLLDLLPQDDFCINYTATILNNLGNLLSNLGRLEDAKGRFEKALEIYEALLKNDPENVGYQSDVAMTLNNLGNLLSNIGRLEDAKARYEKALEIYEALLKNDPENVGYQSYVGTTLNNLGALFSSLGRLEDTKDRFEKALEMRQTLLKNDPENVGYQSYVGTTLNNLGNLLRNIGCLEEAKGRYEKALEMRQALLKNDQENVGYQSDVAMTLNNLGNLLSDIGRLEEAKGRYEKALEIYEALLKNDPENVGYQSYVGTTLNNLGNLLSDIGRLEDAKGRYEKALEMRQALLKNDQENVGYQSDVAMTLNNLGNLFSDIGRLEEAKICYKKTLGIFTEPMQYLTIGKKSEAIIRLIGLHMELAEKETQPFNQGNYLREAFQLCKEHQEFFIKHGLMHERKLVTGVGLNAYVDFLMKSVRLEKNSGKRAEEYEKALRAVEKLGVVGEDETVSKLCASASCYLRGRKLVNEALASRQPELELLRQAVDQFKIAKETYDKANVCYCVYTGLLKVLEDVEEFEEIDVPKMKELVYKIVETLPEDVNPEIRASFESIPLIFEEKGKPGHKELLVEFDEKISEIEYKALEKLFGHVNQKIKDYFEEPFSPNLTYENWRLKVIFNDPEKVKGKLTIKAGKGFFLRGV